MTKGIVMEVRKKDCVVLTETGAFVRVRNKGGSIAVGDEITVPQARRSLPRRSWMMGSAAAAAALMLVFVFSVLPATLPGGPAPEAVIADNETVAYISIDINPSVELGIDGKQRVVDINEKNDDGTELVRELSLLGMQVDAAVRLIVEEAENKVLKDRDSADIVITSVIVTEDTEFKEDVLTAGLQEEVRLVLKQHHKEELEAFRVTVWSAPTEVREEAEAQGLSTGKMAFYLKAKAGGADVSVEELKTNSIHDVAVKFKEKNLLSADDSYTKEEMKQLLKQAKEEIKKIKKIENRPTEKDDDDDENDDSDNRNDNRNRDEEDVDDKGGNKKGWKHNGKADGRNNNGKGGGMKNDDDDDRDDGRTSGGRKEDQEDRDQDQDWDRDDENGDNEDREESGDKEDSKEKDKDKNKNKDKNKGDGNNGENEGNGRNKDEREEDREKDGRGREDESNTNDEGRTGNTDVGLKPGKEKNSKKYNNEDSGSDNGNDSFESDNSRSDDKHRDDSDSKHKDDSDSKHKDDDKGKDTGKDRDKNKKDD